jgi:hypothetical protein
MVTLALVVARAGPADDAQQRMEARGPHVATYLKASTGETVLTVHYRSPREAMLVARNDESTVRFAVDPTHLRLAVDEACGALDYAGIHARAVALSLGLDDDTTAQPRLTYRTTDAENIDVGVSYVAQDTPMVFSWHADLDEEGVVLERTKKTWTARLGDAEWTLDAKTGVLQRMTVGDDALVLDRLVSGRKAKPERAASACPTPTSQDLVRQLGGLFEVYSVLTPYSVLVEHWDDLDPSKREEAVAGMRTWWTRQVSQDLGPWTTEWLAAYEEPLRAKAGDTEGFSSFCEANPDLDRARALAVWQREAVAGILQAVLETYATSTLQQLTSKLDGVGSFDDAAVRTPLLWQPLEAAVQEQGLVHAAPHVAAAVEAATAGLATPP